MKSVLWVAEQYRASNGTWMPLANTTSYSRESARYEMANRKTWKSFSNERLRVAKYVRAA